MSQHAVGDGLRLAVGTLSVYPVPPPRSVDRRSGSWAMTFAPLVGVLLALVAALPLWLLGWAASPLLAAALTIGLLALLTRGIHLDGLADTVDGLGSGKPAEQALGIMRKSDVGPFGVVTLVLVLLVEVFALAQNISLGRGALSLAIALVLSRLMLPVVCSRGVPAARSDGLGQAVAGSVSPAQLGLAVAFSAIVLGAAAAAVPADGSAAEQVLQGVVVALIAVSSGATMCLWSVRRLGGVTGDVMGACVEVTFTVALVVLAFP